MVKKKVLQYMILLHTQTFRVFTSTMEPFSMHRNNVMTY